MFLGDGNDVRERWKSDGGLLLAHLDGYAFDQRGSVGAHVAHRLGHGAELQVLELFHIGLEQVCRVVALQVEPARPPLPRSTSGIRSWIFANRPTAVVVIIEQVTSGSPSRSRQNSHNPAKVSPPPSVGVM